MSTENPSAVMLRLVQGAWVTQSLYAVATLGVADHLTDGPRTSAELAAATGAHADSLHRVLRYLVSLGVFAGDDASGFRLTPVGELLRSDVPGSARDRALMYGTYNYRAFAELLHTVRTGETAFDHVFGMQAYQYIGEHPEIARSFDRQMQTGGSFFAHLAEQYDFSGAQTVVDVAGGNGTLLATLLTAVPELRGILLDAGHVIEAARDNLRTQGVLDRCELVAGSFLDAVPEGGDVYTLSRILHNWDDETCGRILERCHAAMDANATLLVLERLIPEDGSPSVAQASDINMLAVFGGRERTATEFRTLLDKAGFDLSGQRELPPDTAVLVARRR
ncbi:methyltransferase [Actinoallomurus vinaceus]|uniref:Methyltransferase n=1 Tax=Actinoallomurus vinaceus TaxID=1080074 RepID=A0ABP8UDV1_9ACTN